MKTAGMILIKLGTRHILGMTFLMVGSLTPKIHYDAIIGSQILGQNFPLGLGSRYYTQIRD